MKCSCPKCTASIQVEDPASPERGNYVNCPECNGRFWIHLEPFALRALKKGGKVFCRQCGEEPGPDSYCRSCVTLCPDYWMVTTSKPARRVERKASYSFRAPAIRRRSASPAVEKGQPRVSSSADRSTNKTFLIYAAGLVLIVALALAGGNFYLKNQKDREFSTNYVLTLYGIKSGTEASLKQLTNMLDTGKPLEVKEEAKLKAIKAEIDQYRQKLEMPSDKFLASNDSLSKYYNVYSGLHQLAISSSGASPELPGKIEAMKINVARAETELKNNLSDQLLDQVRIEVVKYRSLQFVVQ